MVTLVNRAKVATATTGTGTITLGSAESGYQSFADAGVVDTDVVRYVIEDGTDWEIGTGTYSAGTLTRTVLESSNADASLNLSGSAVVYVSATEADFREEGVGTITGQTLDLTTGSVFSYTPVENTTFVFSNPPASGTAYGMTLKVTGAVVGTNYDIANASYANLSFSVAGQETIQGGVSFKDDGTKMYVIGLATDAVYQYTLSTAWDVTTASYDNVSLSVASQEAAPSDLFFKTDGGKLYVIGFGGDSIYEYTLSTAWDLTTAAYSSASFNVAAQETSPSGLAFRPDGSQLFVVGTDSDAVHRYTLATPWDISTATFDNMSFSTAAQDGTVAGVAFSDDGQRMFTIGGGNDAVYAYDIATPWDISTATYSGTSFGVGAQDTIPLGLTFGQNGASMFVAGNGSDTIYQYTTGSSILITISYPASVKWSDGTAPDAPAAGETDVLVFYTQDGGTTYYGFLAGGAMA